MSRLVSSRIIVYTVAVLMTIVFAAVATSIVMDQSADAKPRSGHYDSGRGTGSEAGPCPTGECDPGKGNQKPGKPNRGGG